MEIAEQRFAAYLAAVLGENDPLEPARPRNSADRHRADKEIALPFRDARAAIKGDARGRDRRHPEYDGRNEIRAPGLRRSRQPAVVAAVGHERPAEVLSRL